MKTYRIDILNQHFDQSGEMEAEDDIAAWTKAMESAITIAADQVSHGSPFFGAVLTLSQGKQQIGRYVISVGATPLKE